MKLPPFETAREQREVHEACDDLYYAMMDAAEGTGLTDGMIAVVGLRVIRDTIAEATGLEPEKAMTVIAHALLGIISYDDDKKKQNEQ